MTDLRCIVGVHAVPRNWAFMAMGAAFQGGLCRRCGKLKQGEFLGNLWDTEKREDGVLMLEVTTGECLKVFDGYEVRSIND